MPSLSLLTKKSSLSYSSSSSALSYSSSSASSVSSLSPSASSVSGDNFSINHTIVSSHRMPINATNMSNIITETEKNDLQHTIYNQARHRLMKRRYDNNGQAPAQQNMNTNNNSTNEIPSDICFIAKDKKKIQTDDMPFPMDL
jgi:hypothetical protein